jgi:leucyl/phenylalanyl-tRNA---protein transferase
MRLTPDLLLAAYCQGIFPMADETGSIGWYEPNPRAILPLETFRVPRRLARTVRQARFAIRVDTAFQEVIAACAEPATGREHTWISQDIIDAYSELHRLGFVHSVETWQDGQLVGGLYGVAIRGLFAGESMFSRARDASKVALVHLVDILQRGGFVLLDTQYIVNDHFRQFGVMEISRSEYKRRLQAALEIPARFVP